MDRYHMVCSYDMVKQKEGDYVLFEDHQAALKAKDEEIERLKEQRRTQSDYNIQLQRLLESLQYEETPYPHLHHHSIVSKYKKSYNTLLATAVKFAELISFDHQGKWQDEADTFLDRPEVKAWRKEK